MESVEEKHRKNEKQLKLNFSFSCQLVAALIINVVEDRGEKATGVQLTPVCLSPIRAASGQIYKLSDSYKPSCVSIGAVLRDCSRKLEE